MTLSVCDITVVEFWPTLLYNTDPPQHFNGLRSGLWLGHYTNFILFFFSHRCADLPLLLGSLSCCIAQLFPSFSCQTASCLALEYFSIQTGLVPVVQNKPNHCARHGYECLCWYAVLQFHQAMCRANPDQTSPLWSTSYSRSLFRSGLVMFS